MQLKVLDLFSGIGGFSLGLEITGGFTTTAFCEIDEDCRKVLKKHWPTTKIYKDVRDVKNETADIVCGGFPCQPFSSINTRGKRGDEHDSFIWPEMLRVISETRPSWVLAENVLRFKAMALDEVQDDLERVGYESIPFDVPACSVGSPQLRQRIFIVAYPKSEREPRALETSKSQTGENDGSRGQENRGFVRAYAASTDSGRSGEWSLDPGICRTAPGLPTKLDKIRLKQLGNSVNPKIVQIFGDAILACNRKMER